MTLRTHLRAVTADDHDRLDAMFGRFDLTGAETYRAFLRAHARALAPVEDAIARSPAAAGWTPRAPLLAADLTALGELVPAPMAVPPADDAQVWGMRYVVEGSRLGGAMLARQVAGDLPSAYLGAQHGKGEWRGFLDALEAAGESGGEAWRARAADGARATFALFARSAEQEAASDAD